VEREIIAVAAEIFRWLLFQGEGDEKKVLWEIISSSSEGYVKTNSFLKTVAIKKGRICMKHIKRSVSLVILCTIVLVFCGVFAAQAQMVLKLSEIHAKGYPTELADEEFARLVELYTKGQIKVDVFPGGQISGDEKVVIEQVKIGAIAIARVSSGALGSFNAQLNVFALPFIFESKAHMWSFLNGAAGQKMLADLAPSGFVGLCWYDGGARSFYANYPLNTINDLKGKKFRVMPNAILVKMVEAMGASAVPMGAGQVFSAIQTGVIDGAENNAPSLISFNHYQVAKYYMLDEHLRLPEVLFMSKMVWDKLSKDQQAAIRKAAVETVDFQRKKWDAYEVEALNKIKAEGQIIVEVKDKTPFKNAVKQLLAEESPNFAETLKAIDAARPKK
jgi:tripartite ATP-independent transporter DctP family solute receptor